MNKAQADRGFGQASFASGCVALASDPGLQVTQCHCPSIRQTKMHTPATVLHLLSYLLHRSSWPFPESETRVWTQQ